MMDDSDEHCMYQGPSGVIARVTSRSCITYTDGIVWPDYNAERDLDT